MSNADDFGKALWDEALVMHDAMTEGMKVITRDLFGRILRRTPVDTGKLLANWQVGVTQRIRGRVKATRRKRARFSRAEATGIANAQLEAALDALQDPFTEITIVNNQGYAEFVRLKNGGPTLSDLVELSVREVENSVYEVGV